MRSLGYFARITGIAGSHSQTLSPPPLLFRPSTPGLETLGGETIPAGDIRDTSVSATPGFVPSTPSVPDPDRVKADAPPPLSESQAVIDSDIKAFSPELVKLSPIDASAGVPLGTELTGNSRHAAPTPHLVAPKHNRLQQAPAEPLASPCEIEGRIGRQPLFAPDRHMNPGRPAQPAVEPHLEASDSATEKVTAAQQRFEKPVRVETDWTGFGLPSAQFEPPSSLEPPPMRPSRVPSLKSAFTPVKPTAVGGETKPVVHIGSLEVRIVPQPHPPVAAPMRTAPAVTQGMGSLARGFGSFGLTQS